MEKAPKFYRPVPARFGIGYEIWTLKHWFVTITVSKTIEVQINRWPLETR